MFYRCFNSDMSITVRSAYGAEEGDAVSICYTDSLWTTQARRENLVYSKVKNCQNISTQFNSFMSGFSMYL